MSGFFFRCHDGYEGNGAKLAGSRLLVLETHFKTVGYRHVIRR